MDCRTFRRLHLSFLDDTLPGADRAEMEAHREGCSECANHDLLLRQSLLLARNIAPIEPSADFQERLRQRLSSVQPDRRTVYVRARPELYPIGTRNGGIGALGVSAFVIAACALLAVGLATFGSTFVVDGGGTAAAVVQAAAMPAAANGVGSASAAATAAAQDATTHGYTLDMYYPAASDAGSDMMLMLVTEDEFDPAIVTSASVGLTVWPALMIPDELPRAFREAGFSVAGMQH